jgi:hypothetical protein
VKLVVDTNVLFGAEPMKTILCLVCLSLACQMASADEAATQPSSATEATGGMADVALRPSDLGDHWIREIKLLFDPQARPSEIYQVATNVRRRKQVSAAQMEKHIAKQKEEKRAFFSRTLAGLGAEAQMILEYYDSKHDRHFSMTIYRYSTVEALNSMWKSRRESSDFNVATMAGETIVYTRVGKVFPGGVKASQTSVETREGRFHIMASPGKPERDDPGLSLMRKQVEKLRNNTEPGVAPNGGPTTSPAKSKVINGPPSVN